MGDMGTVETSTLILLSIVSLLLSAYLFVICWRYFAVNRKKVHWKDEGTKFSLSWLDMERKPLIPGHLTARTVQPSPPASDSGDDLSREVDFENEFDESLGRIIFVLRYSGERGELMVRLIQIEGLTASRSMYDLDTAYVDVHLEYTGPSDQETKYSNPPKLDLCLQQVYYFIISHDQLFMHSLVFRVNTFDEEYRRTLRGEVFLDLIEELGQNMFTGNEVFLIKEIMPVSKGLYAKEQQDEYIYDSEEEDRCGALSPVSSHMSWEPEYLHDELTDVDTVPSSDSTSRSADSVPWKRLRKRGRKGNNNLILPDTFGSVTSVPSAFKFPPDKKFSLDFGKQISAEQQTFPSFPRISKKFSVSDTYIPKYGSLNPPPKDFYHLLPDTPLTAHDLLSETITSNESPPKRHRWTSLRRKYKRMISEVEPPYRMTELERSNSWPSLRSSSTGNLNSAPHSAKGKER